MACSCGYDEATGALGPALANARKQRRTGAIELLAGLGCAAALVVMYAIYHRTGEVIFDDPEILLGLVVIMFVGSFIGSWKLYEGMRRLRVCARLRVLPSARVVAR